MANIWLIYMVYIIEWRPHHWLEKRRNVWPDHTRGWGLTQLVTLAPFAYGLGSRFGVAPVHHATAVDRTGTASVPWFDDDYGESSTSGNHVHIENCHRSSNGWSNIWDLRFLDCAFRQFLCLMCLQPGNHHVVVSEVVDNG